MKKFKSIFALTLALILCFSTVAFASEDTAAGIPEYATKHTLEITLNPEDEYSVAPCIWGDPSVTMIDNHTVDLSSFYVSDRYFAFEMEGIPASGTPTSQGYSVALRYSGASTVASMSGNADGSNYKKDWITLPASGNYYFRVTNATNYVLTVSITYYSWN